MTPTTEATEGLKESHCCQKEGNAEIRLWAELETLVSRKDTDL